MRSYDAFLRYVLARAPKPRPERVNVESAAERLLLESVRAGVRDPAESRSAMDGYAVRHRDLEGASAGRPLALRAVGLSQAGRVRLVRLGAGQAHRIMTGAPLPSGADAVVQVERVTVKDGRVFFRAQPVRGEFVRRPGENFKKGALLVKRGAVMRAQEIGLCITAGVRHVTVARRLKVGVLATGNELVGTARSLKRGEVYDSNRPTLLALVASVGAEPVDLGVVRDDPASLAREVRRWKTRLDCLVTIGGVSMGDFDVVKQALVAFPGVHLVKVGMKPAKPQAFGRLGKMIWYGLPGNPVSAMIAFDRFVRPLLLSGMGGRTVHRPQRTGVLAAALRKSNALCEFARAYAWQEGETWYVRKVGPEGSSNLRSMVNANALIVLSEATRNVARGARVTFELLADGPRPPRP